MGPFCETDTVCHSKWCPSSPAVSTVGRRENMQKHHTSPPLDDWGDYRCNRGWGATKPLIHLDPNLKQLIFFDGMGGSWDDVMMVGLSKPFPPENQRIFQIWWHYITLLFLQQEPDEFCWSHFFSEIFQHIRSDSQWFAMVTRDERSPGGVSRSFPMVSRSCLDHFSTCEKDLVVFI